MPSESTIWFRLIRTVEHRIKTKSEVFLFFLFLVQQEYATHLPKTQNIILHEFVIGMNLRPSYFCSELCIFGMRLCPQDCGRPSSGDGSRGGHRQMRGKGQKQSPAIERGNSWFARVGKVIFKNTIPPQNICFDV